MECTQRLECTQDLYGSQNTHRECFEQIGFLGICGKKYPVKKGPNKIGRDPQTCQIVLNLNSISRQHAVINVLHHNQYMLMDLDSSNKTKLGGKTLQPYIPEVLVNGDTVQFGDVFGVFRLCAEREDELLPMTQALELPDTPAAPRHAARLATTVPESPDVSDKDDSFIVASQQKGPTLKNINNHNFIKPGKTISIQPIGSKRIDNVFWNSSKKSASLLDESVNSHNDSSNALHSNSIHDMDTEAQGPENHETSDNIHSANTQLPTRNVASPNIYLANTQLPNNASPSTFNAANTQMHTGSPSIHTANTQLPNDIYTANTQVPGFDSPSNIHNANTQHPDTIDSPNIHSLETQIPVIHKLPHVKKLNAQLDMQLDLYAENKQNNNKIYNSETQHLKNQTKYIDNKKNNEKLNTSNDAIVFEEVDDGFDNDIMESQAILTDDILLPSNRLILNPEIVNDIEPEPDSEIIMPTSAKRNMRIDSNDSTDCDDTEIVATQKVPKVKCNEDDETDCEEDMIELNVDGNKHTTDVESNFADMATQVIPTEELPANSNIADIDDMPTQVLDDYKLDFEDLPTQVLEEDAAKDQTTLQTAKEIESPFKVPSASAVKGKAFKTPKIKPIADVKKSINSNLEDENYYQDTQDIFEDLCTQRIPSLDGIQNQAGDNEDNSSTNKLILDQSFSDTDCEEKVNKFVSNLSSEDIREVIGVSDQVAKPKRVASDSSDVDLTPKKIRSIFMDIDLPNSQEIKTSVSYKERQSLTDTSSDSETENNSEELCTPILFYKKKKTKKDSKVNLTKMFEAQALPTRVITRVRKPTSKIQDIGNGKRAGNILKPTFFTEQEDNIDKEIITENISRLKTHEKSKAKDEKETKLNIKSKESDSKPVKPPATRGRPRKHIEQTINKTNNNTDKDNKRKINKDNKQPNNEENKRNIKEIRQEDKKQNNIEKNKTIVKIPREEPPVAEKRRTRNTRSSRSDDTTEHKDTEKRTRNRRKEVKELSPNKVDVRRSKRQRNVKEKEQTEIKSILKKSVHEQSTVYNVSCESPCAPRAARAARAPRACKRSAEPERAAPRAKRTRPAPAAPTAPTQHRVLFTAFPYEQLKGKLEELGAAVVSEVRECSVLVTAQVRRTFKLLCGVGLGRPVVGARWVHACIAAATLLDPWEYVLKDEAAEARFQFSLEQTLRGPRGFLRGLAVCSTPSVQPAANEMKQIVECSGGEWRGASAECRGAVVCVSCAADRAQWGALRDAGLALVSTEFILAGVLTQRADIDKYALPAQ